MMPRFHLRCVWPPIIVVLAGCVGVSEPGAQRAQPAMPTVTIPVTPRHSEVPDDTLVLDIGQTARGGDLTAAAQKLAGVEDRLRRARLAGVIAQRLIDPDPVLAVRFGESLPVDQAQSAALAVGAAAWAQRDGDAALRWAHGLAEPATARVARVAVANELVAKDPRGAIQQVRVLPADTARDDTLIIVAAAWARRDADATLGWVQGLPDDEMKTRLTSAVGFEVAQHHPDRAIPVAEMLPAGRNRWLLFSAIAQTWVATDTKAAIAWANRLPPGEPRDAAFAGVNTGLGIPIARRQTGPLSTRRGTTRIRGGGGMGVMPENSPDFAAWLATQPSGLRRDDAILEYVRQRGALQPEVVGQWLATLPGTPTRNRAIELYIDELLIGSPADAARWLRSMPRSDRTDEMIEKTARRWLTTNPDAAREWVREMPLPEDEKARLLRAAPPP